MTVAQWVIAAAVTVFGAVGTVGHLLDRGNR